MRAPVPLLYLLLALFLTACTEPGGPAHSAPPQAVVVDLVAVAKALGRDEVMERQLQQARANLNAQLQAIGADLQEQLEEERERLEQAGNEDAPKRLEALTREANLQLRQTRLAANQRAQAYRNELVRSFQEDVRAVARQIAKGRGAQSVVSANAGMLWFDPETDITDEVIADMRARSQEGAGTEEGSPAPTSRADSPGAGGGDSAMARETRKLEALMDELSAEGQAGDDADSQP